MNYGFSSTIIQTGIGMYSGKFYLKTVLLFVQNIIINLIFIETSIDCSVIFKLLQLNYLYHKHALTFYNTMK